MSTKKSWPDGPLLPAKLFLVSWSLSAIFAYHCVLFCLIQWQPVQGKGLLLTSHDAQCPGEDLEYPIAVWLLAFTLLYNHLLRGPNFRYNVKIQELFPKLYQIAIFHITLAL